MIQTCEKTTSPHLLIYYIPDTTILGDCQVLLRAQACPGCLGTYLPQFLVGPSEVSVIRVQVERANLIDMLVDFL